MGGLCLLVKLHREGSAPAACAAALFFYRLVCRTDIISNNDSIHQAKIVLVGWEEVGADVLLQLRGVGPHRAGDQPEGGLGRAGQEGGHHGGEERQVGVRRGNND